MNNCLPSEKPERSRIGGKRVKRAQQKSLNKSKKHQEHPALPFLEGCRPSGTVERGGETDFIDPATWNPPGTLRPGKSFISTGMYPNREDRSGRQIESAVLVTLKKSVAGDTNDLGRR